jgi:hypothetical protein
LAAATVERSRGVRRSAAGVATPARSRWWVEALLVVWLAWVYDSMTNLAPVRVHAALANARGVLSLEQALHIDPEHTLDRWLAAHHTLGLLVSDYYDNAHFVVTLGLLGWLWWRRADVYRPLRNILLLTNVIAFVVFWRYPVAPPRMLPGFSDVVGASGAFGSWHSHSGLASHANELAAMPSLHMAWAAWCVLVVWKLTDRVWLRALALVHVAVTAAAVLATGNHYLLDLIGGLAALAAALLIAGLWDAVWRGVPDVTKLLRSAGIASMRRAPSDRLRV